MQAVAGVAPFQHIWPPLGRPSRVALGQQVGLLVLVGQHAAAGSVGLCPDQMAEEFEAGRLPGSDELVGMVPAVKTDAEAPWFQDSVDFGKGGFEPLPAAVAGQCAAGAVA